jgi:hypothetical protein
LRRRQQAVRNAVAVHIAHRSEANTATGGTKNRSGLPALARVAKVVAVAVGLPGVPDVQAVVDPVEHAVLVAVLRRERAHKNEREKGDLVDPDRRAKAKL